MLDKIKVQAVHQDIREALEVVAKKYGLVLSERTNIKYTATTFKFTAEFGDETETGSVDPKFYANARKYAWRADLDIEQLGKEIDIPMFGKATWIGMTGPSKIVVTAAKDGKNYTIRADQLARMMKKQ
jgi:hypothetical protein